MIAWNGFVLLSICPELTAESLTRFIEALHLLSENEHPKVFGRIKLKHPIFLLIMLLDTLIVLNLIFDLKLSLIQIFEQLVDVFLLLVINL